MIGKPDHRGIRHHSMIDQFFSRLYYDSYYHCSLLSSSQSHSACALAVHGHELELLKRRYEWRGFINFPNPAGSVINLFSALFLSREYSYGIWDSKSRTRCQACSRWRDPLVIITSSSSFSRSLPLTSSTSLFCARALSLSLPRSDCRCFFAAEPLGLSLLPARPFSSSPWKSRAA